MPAKKTLAEQLALAANPEPQEIDPEDFEYIDHTVDSDSGNSDNGGDEDRTGHYIDVGRSKMREDGIALSEGKYKGTLVSRSKIGEESDVSGEEVQDESEESSESEESTNKREYKPSGISQILSAEQKHLLERLNSSSDGDVEKGKAVSAQMKVYEGLLDLRIQTQKILNMTNKLSLQAPNSEHSTKIYPLISKVLSLRARLAGTTNTSECDSLDSLQEFTETLDLKLRDQRETVLNKWTRKIELSSGRNALQSSKFRSLGQSSALQVSTVLNDMPRLVKRTQVDRSEYKAPPNHPWLFDDTDFYRLLLKDLVDRRMADGSGDSQGLKWKAAVHKQKKKVDTKASKDRKLKYTIIEKIQGFDAPRNVFKWSDKQAEDLYSGLLGIQISMDDNERDEVQPNAEVEVGDFNLFG